MTIFWFTFYLNQNKPKWRFIPNLSFLLWLNVFQENYGCLLWLNAELEKTPRIQKIIICLYNENRLLGEDRWVWNCGSLVMLQPLPRTRLIFRWCHLGQAWNASDARIPWSRLHHHVRAMLWHSQNEGAAWLRRFLNDQEHLRRHRCLNYSELTSKFF